MKVTGIIAEYNPLHSGHQYHMDAARSLTGADYLIVVMSGNYTQRGEAAVMDKYLRTRMALLTGADLVLELPLPWSVGSAEYFAMGSVTLLDKLGITDSLCFGSEIGEIDPLKKVAQILVSEPEEYRKVLQEKVSAGVPFPAAQARALSIVSGADASLSPLDTPNNRLGVEYLKALLRRRSSITPYTIKRLGGGYHDSDLKDTFSSASAIRQSILGNNSVHPVLPQIVQKLKGQVPDELLPLFEKEYNHTYPISQDDFSSMLHYKLLYEAQKNSSALTDYWDVTADLSDRIANLLPEFTTYSRFCDLLKTKNITYTRISRSLLHILLKIRADQVRKYIAEDYISYARILGFRKSASPLLHEIKKHSSVPLVSKPADAHKQLSPLAQEMFESEITAGHLYETVKNHKFFSAAVPIKNEYTREIVIL